MLDYDAMYGSRYLSAADISETTTVTIVKVEDGEFKQNNGGMRKKAVLSFKELEKQLILNPTNANCLRNAFGKNFASWVGKRIALRVESVNFAGRVVDGLRTYPVTQRLKAAPQPDPSFGEPSSFDGEMPPPFDANPNDAIPF
jgi:hypothetical protein